MIFRECLAIRKQLIIAALFSAILFLHATTGAESSSVLRVGINKSMPPFSYFDPSASRYRGFCLDLARLLGGVLNRSIRFVPMPYHELPEALFKGDIDIISGYVDIPSDSQRFHFVDTTVNVERGLFVNKSCLTVTCAKDLAGQKVVMEQGQDIRRYVENPQAVRFVEAADQETALAMVSDGSAKAFISHNVLTTRFLIQKNNLIDVKEVGMPLDAAPLAMILRNQEVDLISRVSFAYGQLVENRKYQTLVDKWFGKPYAPTIWNRYVKFLLGGLAVIVALLVVFVYLNRSLKRRVEKVSDDLQMSEKRYQELIESSPDMITLVDRHGNIILANRKTCELLGYSSEEIDELTMTELIKGPQHNSMIAFVARVFDRGTARDSFETRSKTGSMIYLEIVAQTVQHEVGNRDLACFFCRDITQRKRLQEELIESERMAVMGQMAAGLAHEINNPLGIILANTEEVLYADAASNVDKECLQAIERNAMRAASIIENLLSFTRPGQSEKTRVDATQLVAEAVFFLRHKLKKAKVRVDTDYETTPIMLVADESQFQQMVINLVLNSIEAMSDGGHLKISLSSGNQNGAPVLILTVQDNGSGIPQEELDKIFNPFFTARKRKGFGLGLFITKGIVEAHQGSISAESNVGQGTTIRVELPLEPRDHASRCEHQQPQVP